MDAATDPAGNPPARHTGSRRGGQRVPTWGLIAIAGVLGIVVGLIAPTAATSPSSARLRPVAAGSTEFPFDWYYVIDRETLVRYDSYGVVDVWSGENQQGVPCLLVAVAAESLIAGCTPGELEPTVDLNITGDLPNASTFGLSPGSLLRFVLRDEVVRVWVAEASEG